MANHDVEKGCHAVRQRTEVEGAVDEKPGLEAGGKDPDERREVRLLWPWLKQHRASVVVLFCFVTICALAVLLPLLLGGSDQPLPIPAHAPKIDLNYTRYVGEKLANGVNAFLGMRYAAPPIGDSRWRDPDEPEMSTQPWESALAFQPVCLGNAVLPPYLGEDEDCLFVNVWAPSNATVNSQLPVWVFIQGGGYVFNSNANYDGAEVVEKSGYNIVMVNFNYRVGVWGFLASERLRADGDLNVGLLDQRRLLLWVKQHISKFGGDPDHVVIHGASAGAGSVALHMSAYGGRDDHLFVGAISESLFFPAQPYVSELEWQFDRVLQAVGCYSYDSAAAMACLRGQDMGTLQSLNVALTFPGRMAPPNPLFYWTPCIDGDFIQDLPYVLFERGRFLKMPVMFGTDTDEGSAFAPNAASASDLSSFFQDNYPLLTQNDTQAILSLYPQVLPQLPYHTPWFPTAFLAYGEATFICPSLNLLSQITSYTPPHNTLLSIHPSINPP